MPSAYNFAVTAHDPERSWIARGQDRRNDHRSAPAAARTHA